MTSETIGSRIQQKRLAKGWTPFDLSVESGIRESNIRGWEKGRTPLADAIPALADALGTSPTYLLTGEEDFAKAHN